METPWEWAFLKALLYTIVTETGVLFQCSRWLIPGKPTVALRLFAGITASSLTLPYLWFVLPMTGMSFLTYAVTGEMAVALVEAVFYLFVFRMTFYRALLLSLCCNAVSLVVGMLLG